MERMKKIHLSCTLQVEKERDPDDPNANGHGYVWVVSVCPPKNGEKLYLCTDGCIR